MIFPGEKECPDCGTMVAPDASHVCLKGELVHGYVVPPRVEDTRTDTDRPYYDAGNLKAIDVIQAYARDNFLRGTALKYLMRAGRKDDLVADLRKAIWYIEREIAAHV